MKRIKFYFFSLFGIHRTKKGFSLIEMLVFLFIFALITTTFYATWTTGTRFILLAKNRLVANALVNEKMEIVRNLAFEDIAHTTSFPKGNLKQYEDVVRGGRIYRIFTQIKNVDDPFDGTAVEGTDLIAPIDYKYVKITVSWDNETQRIETSSRFVPAGIEQPATGMGVLVINVTSDKDGGALVGQSSVRIRNTSIGFDETHSTDNFGRLLMVGLGQSIKQYEITLTKNGYETVSTMPPYPSTSYNPTHEHASVVATSVNTIDMFQNKLSNLTIKTIDYLGNSVADINFLLKGGRKLGTDSFDPNIAIYGLDSAEQTGTNGEKRYENISPGKYNFTFDEAGYSVIGINPIESFSETNPNEMSFSIVPDNEAELKVEVSPNNITALLVEIKDSNDNRPVSGASVHLTNGSGYDATITTESDGMAFFPNVENPPFLDGTYDVSISVSGYDNYSGQASVNAGELKKEAILLNPS